MTTTICTPTPSRYQFGRHLFFLFFLKSFLTITGSQLESHHQIGVKWPGRGCFTHSTEDQG